MTALGDDGDDGDRARRRLRGNSSSRRTFVDLEVVSAWRRLTAAGDLDERRARLALDDLRALRLERVPHEPLLERCWELRANLTVHDSAYVALAELMDAVLVTADGKLAASSGPRCPIELVT